ncbi:MAG: hypothetical protein K9G62_01760 [Alphaproteobacteria bacterium]|nr:hypothetical protein [Alphaproteobacteria bacterium]
MTDFVVFKDNVSLKFKSFEKGSLTPDEIHKKIKSEGKTNACHVVMSTRESDAIREAERREKVVGRDSTWKLSSYGL